MHYEHNAAYGDPTTLTLQDAVKLAANILVGPKKTRVKHQLSRGERAYSVEEELRRVEAQMAKTRRRRILTPQSLHR